MQLASKLALEIEARLSKEIEKVTVLYNEALDQKNGQIRRLEDEYKLSLRDIVQQHERILDLEAQVKDANIRNEVLGRRIEKLLDWLVPLELGIYCQRLCPLDPDHPDYPHTSDAPDGVPVCDQCIREYLRRRLEEEVRP